MDISENLEWLAFIEVCLCSRVVESRKRESDAAVRRGGVEFLAASWRRLCPSLLCGISGRTFGGKIRKVRKDGSRVNWQKQAKLWSS